MRKMLMLSFMMLVATLALSAITPDWEIGQEPVFVTESFYDYMNGGYYDLPIAEFPLALGGGRVMTYHARRGNYTSLRKVYFTYIDGLGQIEPVVDPWQDVSVTMGYPSLAFDHTLNRSLYSWHEYHDADTPLEVVFMHEVDPIGIPGLYSERFPVFDPPALPPGHENDEFIWPSIKTGPSPTPGMSRVYILARNYSDGAMGNPSENVMIAYADYDEALLNSGQNLSWSYTTIPLLDDWHNSTGDIWRRMSGSFAVGDDGRLYYAGYHGAYDEVAGETVNEPNLDVFVCDNYGAGTWQHYSYSSKIPSYNPYNNWLISYAFYYGIPPEEVTPIPDEDIYYSIANSSHFNIYIDAEGNLHMPGVWMLHLGEPPYSLYEATTVKEAVFDPDTGEFTIREVYPVAGTSSDDQWWMPWDTNGNLAADYWPWTQPQPDMTMNCFPWCHWDIDQGFGIMPSQCNYTRLTGSADGTLVCLWEDSYKARMYHLNPADSLQYAAYTDTPEIYLAVSPDNGAHWLEPIVFSAVDTPSLTGMTPMWVNPSDDFISITHEDDFDPWKRLYLMFLNDFDWGPALPPSHELPGGNIMYMALDFEVPTVAVSEETPPVADIRLRAYPNPFQSNVILQLSIPLSMRNRAEQIEVNIHNIRGQKVRSFLCESDNRNEITLLWDGCDSSGTHCGDGIYLLRATHNGKTIASRKLSLLSGD